MFISFPTVWFCRPGNNQTSVCRLTQWLQKTPPNQQNIQTISHANKDNDGVCHPFLVSINTLQSSYLSSLQQ